MTKLIEAWQENFDLQDPLGLSVHQAPEMVKLFWKSWHTFSSYIGSLNFLEYPPISLFFFSCPAHYIALFCFVFLFSYKQTFHERSKCQLIVECLDCLTIMLFFGPLVSRWGCGVSHLAAGTDYRRIHSTLITSSACHPPQPAVSPPEASPAKIKMHYSHTIEV